MLRHPGVAAFTAGTRDAQGVWFSGQPGSPTETSQVLPEVTHSALVGKEPWTNFSLLSTGTQLASEEALLVGGCGRVRV